jgi:hypothetical protein
MNSLSVDVVGDKIVVTIPGTAFNVTYEKDLSNSHLLLTESWIEPTVTSPMIAEFRLRAFEAAMAKAKDLGWIA